MVERNTETLDEDTVEQYIEDNLDSNYKYVDGICDYEGDIVKVIIRSEKDRAPTLHENFTEEVLEEGFYIRNIVSNLRTKSIRVAAKYTDLDERFFEEQTSVVEQVAGELDDDSGYEYGGIEVHRSGDFDRPVCYGYIDEVRYTGSGRMNGVPIGMRREIEQEYGVRLTTSAYDGRLRLYVHTPENLDLGGDE